MRPKQSLRVNCQGQPIYSYLCVAKEKSRMYSCKMKNPNGNILDKLVCEEIGSLNEDLAEFSHQLHLGKKRLQGSNASDTRALKNLRATLVQHEKEIAALVTTLTGAAGTPSEGYILSQINELHRDCEAVKLHISNLAGTATTQALTVAELDIVEHVLATFNILLGNMNVEQKRAVLRTFIKSAVWDGTCVHLYLL